MTTENPSLKRFGLDIRIARPHISNLLRLSGNAIKATGQWISDFVLDIGEEAWELARLPQARKVGSIALATAAIGIAGGHETKFELTIGNEAAAIQQTSFEGISDVISAFGQEFTPLINGHEPGATS